MLGRVPLAAARFAAPLFASPGPDMFVSSEDDSCDEASDGPAPEAELGLEIVDESSAGGWLPPAYDISDCVCEIPLMLRLRPLPAVAPALLPTLTFPQSPQVHIPAGWTSSHDDGIDP